MIKVNIIAIIVFIFLVSNFVYSITDDQKEQFDKILLPLAKIYDLIRYGATIIASIFLVFSGISYMTSSNDPRKKDTVKLTIGYILVGLAIIWAAPYVVELFLK